MSFKVDLSPSKPHPVQPLASNLYLAGEGFLFTLSKMFLKIFPVLL